MTTEMKEFDAAAYSIVVSRVREDNEDLYFAYVKEVPDISSYNENSHEAYDDCIDSLSVLYADAMDSGKAFPAPHKSPSPSAPSGRVTLRMSRSMHAEIARCADEDGVSLNQWVVEAISQRRGFYASVKAPSISSFVQNSALKPVINKLISCSNVLSPIAGQELKLSSTSGTHYFS